MNTSPRALGWFLSTVASLVLSSAFAAPPGQAGGDAAQIPEALKAWEGWVLWGQESPDMPRVYTDGKERLALWPTRLAVRVDGSGGNFEFGLTVYGRGGWVALPGGRSTWPSEVKANGQPVPVAEQAGRPAVWLEAGTHTLSGAYQWKTLPQNLRVPPAVGMLTLTLNGQPVESPTWDAEGLLWLKRMGSGEEMAKDFLSVKAYAMIEDGIPLWLRTEVELIVSGKSREEEIGGVLPEGWKLAAVESQIPVAIDDAGRMKAQVRAGKWRVMVTAFRLDDVKSIRFAPGIKPAVGEELVGFRAKPDFRMVEVTGAPAVDVSQTTFPAQWRDLPVYRWETNAALGLDERMRGMGSQTPENLRVSREWWLDEDGKGITFRDRISGTRQQIWRLDAAEGEDLGSVRSGGQGQLITMNPENGAAGVEIRMRNINLEATGRVPVSGTLPASGWRTDTEGVSVSLNLPPGWRLLALFGADWVRGDWLTAWSLLDLFLLLIFSLAVFRLWGLGAAVLAFVAFGISYHEPGAPRYVWLALLIPLALARVVPEGWGRKVVAVWKWATIVILVLLLVPFISRQVQQALYPQLEKVGDVIMPTSYAIPADAEDFKKENLPPDALISGGVVTTLTSSKRSTLMTSRSQYADQVNSNMVQDAKARIQTGPGVPEWRWRNVSFGWNGPVQARQTVRPVLIPQPVESVLSLLRVVLLLALAGVLLNARRMGGAIFRGGRVAAIAALLLVAGTTGARAQFPNQPLLDTLRERLTKVPDAFPNVADIPTVSLALDGKRIVMESAVDVVSDCAVPLPGRLAGWGPLSVQVDGKPAVAMRRPDGYLWVVLAKGVHRVRVEGMLMDGADWEWTFLLRPHKVAVSAPGWNVTGVKSDGTPEAQVFFSRQERTGAAAASYDRQEVQPALVVDRHLELGLVWQVTTRVTRLSPPGRAVSLRIPLLPGENVLTSNAIVNDGAVEVRLGSNEESFSWRSELSIAPDLKLATRQDDKWVERWRLVVSPVWNVSMQGLAPIFEPSTPELVPVWNPWPGEEVELKVSRPQAIPGATVTVKMGRHDITVGQRQRTSELTLSLVCSMGEDFAVEIPAEAEVSSLSLNGQNIPVRKDGARVIVPLQPGEQMIHMTWKTNIPLGVKTAGEKVVLPVESANVTTTINLPESRWVLHAYGPLNGPAVRFWVVLICALLVAWVMSRIRLSPLRPLEWALLAIGLTQVHLLAAIVVVVWLYFLVWRGRESFQTLRPLAYNFLQLCLVVTTFKTLIALIAVVGAGLLGSPRMFILGNGSSAANLVWYQARCGDVLPEPGCISVSIWWYRLLMLVWALWLAAALIRWLRWAWEQFSKGGCFRKSEPKAMVPPPMVPPKS